MQNKEIKKLAEHFKGQDFDDTAVAKYCESEKMTVVSAGQVEDALYQIEYDARMTKALPLVLEAIAKMNHVPLFADEEEKKKLMEENDEISLAIAQIVEDNGFEYREIGFLSTISGDVGRVLSDAETRLSNMGASVMAEMAEQHIGNPLTIAGLGNRYREIANEKYLKEKGKEDLEEGEKDNTVVAPEQDEKEGDDEE